MKLKLVMLTTVISMITEIQVEADVECYENRDFSGKVAIIKKSTKDVTRQFPNGPRACKVSPNSIVIFYSKPNFLGDINTFHDRRKKPYYPRSRFTIGSILMLESKHKEEIFFFRNKDYQGGLYQNFFGEIDKVKGNITFESVVVKGDLRFWTVARECHVSDCQRKCLICLKQANSGASFFNSFNSAGMWQTTTILPGVCLGTSYTGVPRIPECPCNQDGVVSGPDECEGKQGICQCNHKKHFTGDDCDSCKPPHVYRNGKCLECKCSLHGVRKNGSMCDPLGKCICGDGFTGKRCGKCIAGRYRVGHACQKCNCYIHGVKNGNPNCNKAGNCECDNDFTGQKCDQCINGKYEVGNACQSCGCDPKGVLDQSNLCHPNGTCICKDKRIGRTCASCEINHFKDSKEQCTACNCYVHGVKNGDLSCNPAGNCTCDKDFTGEKCDRCKNGKYQDGQVCKDCTCDLGGVDKNNICHSNGTCICKATNFGKQCELCAYNAFRESSNSQCTACSCKDNGNKTINGRFRICNETSGDCYGDGYLELFLPGYYKNVRYNKILTCGTNPCEIVSFEVSVAKGVMKFDLRKVIKVGRYEATRDLCDVKVYHSAPYICKNPKGGNFKEKSLRGEYWVGFDTPYRKTFTDITVKVTLKGSIPKLIQPDYSHYYG